MWKVVLAIWGSTALAIGITLYYTHDIRCLWFLLIPACMSYRSNDKAESEVQNDEQKSQGNAQSKVEMF